MAEESPTNSTMYQIAALTVGAAALVFAFAMFLGYAYTLVYLRELGVPPGTVSYSPPEYALANGALVAIVASLLVLVLARAGYQLEGRTFPGGGKRVIALARLVFVLSIIVNYCVAYTNGSFHGRNLEVALAVYIVSLVFAGVSLVLTVRVSRLTFNMVMMSGFLPLLLLWPVGLGTIDARRTLESGYNTQRATIEIGGSSVGTHESFDGDVLLINNGNLFYFDHGNRQAGLRMVPTSSIAKIEYVR